jgi:hypothetical protein
VDHNDNRHRAPNESAPVRATALSKKTIWLAFHKQKFAELIDRFTWQQPQKTNDLFLMTNRMQN